MDGVELHPNWQALASVHFPRKVFIREGTEVAPTAKPKNYKLINFEGKEIKEFYEDVVKDASENPPVSNREHSIRVEKNVTNILKKSFNKNEFFRAATENDIELLKTFDYHVGDINSVDDYGWTALMMAACEGSCESFEFLLKNGASLLAKDKSGNDVRTLASKKGRIQIIKLIEEHELVKEIQPKPLAPERKKFKEIYCSICKLKYKDVDTKKHETSTLHQFSRKNDRKQNAYFQIPKQNRGYELMVKQGWDSQSGLGPSNQGQLYPVKTVIRKQRTGLGIEQNAPRVTHFKPFDLSAVKYRPPPRDKTRKEIYRDRRRNSRLERRLREELS